MTDPQGTEPLSILEGLKRLQAECDAEAKKIKPCSSCGHCPTCGRSAAPAVPQYPYYSPEPRWEYRPWEGPFYLCYTAGDL